VTLSSDIRLISERDNYSTDSRCDFFWTPINEALKGLQTKFPSFVVINAAPHLNQGHELFNVFSKFMSRLSATKQYITDLQ
jgi:hypothetical protein